MFLFIQISLNLVKKKVVSLLNKWLQISTLLVFAVGCAPTTRAYIASNDAPITQTKESAFLQVEFITNQEEAAKAGCEIRSRKGNWAGDGIHRIISGGFKPGETYTLNGQNIDGSLQIFGRCRATNEGVLCTEISDVLLSNRYFYPGIPTALGQQTTYFTKDSLENIVASVDVVPRPLEVRGSGNRKMTITLNGSSLFLFKVLATGFLPLETLKVESKFEGDVISNFWKADRNGEYHAIIKQRSTDQSTGGIAHYIVQSCGDGEILSLSYPWGTKMVEEMFKEKTR